MSEIEKTIYTVKEAELDSIDTCLDTILAVMHLLRDSNDWIPCVHPAAISSVLSLVYGAIGDTVDHIRRETV